jgi:hypothetical protein
MARVRNLDAWRVLQESRPTGMVDGADVLSYSQQANRLLRQMFQVRGRYFVVDISYPYEIGLERLANHAAVLQWARHLAGKRWMDAPLLGEFIERACKAAGINLWEKDF